MSQPGDPANLDEILSEVLDPAAEPADSPRLERLLLDHPELIDEYVDLCLLDALLAESLASEDTAGVQLPLREVARSSASWRQAAIALVACSLVAVVGLLVEPRDDPRKEAALREIARRERLDLAEPDGGRARPIPNVGGSRLQFVGRFEQLGRGVGRVALAELAVRQPPVALAGAVFLAPAVQQARDASRRSEVRSDLKRIGIALHSFEDQHGAFPAAYSADAAGRPLLSWRVHLLPYLGEEKLYARFRLDEAWDSPHNLALAETIPEVYHVPTGVKQILQGPARLRAVRVESGLVVPPDASRFGDATPLGVRAADVTSGLSNTIAVVVAVDDGPWSKPTDFVPAPDDPKGGLVEIDGTFPVLFADGAVQLLNRSIDAGKLESFYRRDDVPPSEN